MAKTNNSEFKSNMEFKEFNDCSGEHDFIVIKEDFCKPGKKKPSLSDREYYLEYGTTPPNLLDQTKTYSTLYCRKCGITKEIQTS